MRAKPLEEAYRVAEAYVAAMNRRAREAGKMDPRFNCAVQVIHGDRTTMFFHSAFVLEWGIYQIVVAEHHDIHVYPEDEAQVFMFRRSDEDVEEIEDLAVLGIDEDALEWGPDPYGVLAKRAAEEEEEDSEP